MSKKIKPIFDCMRDCESFVEMRKNMIFVSWDDHYSGDHGWHSIKDVLDAHESSPNLPCQTCGFLLYEDKETLKIAITINDNAEFSTVFTVLKSTIVERVDFRV